MGIAGGTKNTVLKKVRITFVRSLFGGSERSPFVKIERKNLDPLWGCYAVGKWEGSKVIEEEMPLVNASWTC